MASTPVTTPSSSSRRTRWPRGLAALAGALALAAAVPHVGARLAPGPASTAGVAAAGTSSTTWSTTTSPTPTPPTTTSLTTSTTTSTTLAPPAGLVEEVAARLADPRLAGAVVGLSVWVEGSGEVVTTGADQPLLPGSNEKLLVAAGALAVLGPDAVLTTEVKAAGEIDGGWLHGDLVLVGGGDPSLGLARLDELARQVRAAGVRHVAGDLVADESRYDDRRTAPGWTDWHMPTFVGPLSALAVGRNWLRIDAEYVADPARANAGYFRQALSRAGVTVAGADRRSPGPGLGADERPVVASVESPPVAALVGEMLTRSDNFYAELLVKETGYRGVGEGTTAAGLAAAHAVLDELGVVLTGLSADGSGLSRDNRRPAGEWQRLLVAAAAQPWGRHLLEGLPVAGRTGTLASRFRGRPGEAVVRAKTGSVRGSRALSGYLSTAGGRSVVFSLVVNGPAASAAVGAMDDLVASIAASAA